MNGAGRRQMASPLPRTAPVITHEIFKYSRLEFFLVRKYKVVACST